MKQIIKVVCQIPLIVTSSKDQRSKEKFLSDILTLLNLPSSHLAHRVVHLCISSVSKFSYFKVECWDEKIEILQSKENF